MSSQPQTQLAKAAVPGSERSSTPVITPMPTPAAKRAVSAPAFATRMALSVVKKYGEHQNAKNAIRSPHRMKIPRSRTKTSAVMVRGISCPVGTVVASGPVSAPVAAPVSGAAAAA
ncbi:hypothetical protein [Nocardioides ungokensis]|uniref:hypothetical protein n=1 Tax=Nocardioides ungokensis TaxID=1643322 RepID=UPI0015DDD108|nr:hypothetical protein [Nocardioides ungokensis]